MDVLDLIAVLANLAVVVTVLFLVQQNRVARDQASEASVQIALDGLQDLQMVFVERPHLWPYFRQGVREVPDELRAEVEATAELYLTTIQNLMSLPPAFVRSHWDVWRANVVNDFTRAPILAEIASRDPRLYGAKLHELIASADGRLADVAPPGPRPRAAARPRVR